MARKQSLDLVSPGVDQTWSGQLRDGSTIAVEPTQQNIKRSIEQFYSIGGGG
jgi:hypothetical protein